MDFFTDWINDWIKGVLIDGILGNLNGLFANVNNQVGEIATQVGTTLAAMDIGPLLGLWLQSFLIQVIVLALNIAVFGRMIEIYLLTSLAPIPFATVVNREIGHMGHNYFKSLLAVAFQGILMLVCVAIYAVLVQNIAIGGDPIGAIWSYIGYTVLLCFTLFKTGSLAKSIFGAHYLAKPFRWTYEGKLLKA
ncbi:hypothetical protein Dtox_3152 [Desulfofarcimen acetoxidans DSM 771]|uniref:TrbL/VirB6 plasmid conjugal transfer protein n=1 Tax=Desulfofarcimen acetoxidans (strain ATCC 49208 / DSM 771 / KCTC 5769 / VKM B-1644 / 5575) TaxID=485916 RepID=C8W4L0_DESAS|nr:CD0415/CD1112 family protein [Desulfofarcimen acetoxidans]ACV63896.1 hypothetical protein Dtox_3152 [Desulfofarcimen acetoxidans DSM 771]